MTPTPHHRRQVAAAIRLVREAGGERLPLANLAAAAGASPFHFDRVFRAMTGMGAGRYVRWVRLNRAAVALVEGDEPIVRIALAAGYANHESFSRAFRQQFGRSPREYRREHREAMTAQERDMTIKRAAGVAAVLGTLVAGGCAPQRDAAQASHRTTPHSNSGTTRMSSSTFTVGFVKIPVTDFARATAFYRDVLGLAEEFAVEQYGWAQYQTGSIPICLYVAGMGGGDGKPGVDTGIQLRTTDAKSIYGAIKGRGGKVGELQQGDDGTVGFSVTDPDGNVLSVVQVPG